MGEDIKKESSKRSNVKTETDENNKKKAKTLISVEFKPGQKKETPSPGAGTRVFYESLYKQRPDSFMALKWCIEYGVLPREQCAEKLKLLEKLQAKMKKERENNTAPSKKPTKSKHTSSGADAIDRLGTGGDEGAGVTNL